jgi:cardiolipin synthase
MARRPLRKLRRAGGKVAFFLPIWRITLLNRSNLRDHRKIAVFDGERVFAGGRNLADEYLGPRPDPKRWADFSFVLEGPAAAHYGEIFRYDWAFASREKLSAPGQGESPTQQGDAVIQVVPSGPDVADDQLFAGILSFIFSAKHRLWIVSPYFLPNEMLAEALQIALQRGVDVSGAGEIGPSPGGLGARPIPARFERPQMQGSALHAGNASRQGRVG